MRRLRSNVPAALASLALVAVLALVGAVGVGLVRLPPPGRPEAQSKNTLARTWTRAGAGASRSDRSYSATFTSSVTLLAPGPRLRTSSLYLPSWAGLNFTSHLGPGLVSLPTSLPSSP